MSTRRTVSGWKSLLRDSTAMPRFLISFLVVFLLCGQASAQVSHTKARAQKVPSPIYTARQSERSKRNELSPA